MYTGAEAQGELSLDAPEYLEAAAGLTDMRTTWLKGLVREWNDETLTGVWTDSYGGRIEIVEREGHLHFVIECVRGPTSHVGGLAGIAVWNANIGWFSDKGREDKGDDLKRTSASSCEIENSKSSVPTPATTTAHVPISTVNMSACSR
jgi:hypothetical protein